MENIKIKSIKKLNKSYNKYDLEVEGNHNFFANGILVHNCRCICRKEGNNVLFYSRNGKEFDTLGKLKNEVLKIPGDFILDGELCIINNGMEDFQSIMKEYRRKNHTIENIKYLLFDYLTLDEFDSKGKTSTIIFSERINKLKELNIKSEHISIVEQILIKDETLFTDMVSEFNKLGYEGLMLRKDIPYEGKRSFSLLKVKSFSDAEYKVLDVINSKIRFIENGKQIEKDCLGSIIINHKGNTVNVGSGFTKEQREYYYNNPNELIGKTVTVQFFEETKNENGLFSLRFPTVKYIYTESREV